MRGSLLVMAVLAAALTSACGNSTPSGGSATTTSGPTTATTSASSEDEVAAWADKVCGEIVELVEVQSTPPPNISNTDPSQALTAFDSYMRDTVDAIEQTVDDLKGVGAAPVEGGDEAVTALSNGLDGLKTAYETIRSEFEKVGPNDAQGAQNALLAAVDSLTRAGQDFEKAMESVEESKVLETAGDKAPNCQKLDAGGTSTTSAPTAATTTT